MIINHNLPAMNAQRQMSINNSTLSKSLEKLSSGLAINRASDNAAGLAISEKMRGQISGLNQASTNAQDGISLIQTAEGALNETHSILQRMRELAVQSANGTYQDAVDRENIQKEVDALKTEVDRIATSTHYNNIKLLDGSLAGSDVISGITSTKIAGIPYSIVTATTTAMTATTDSVKSITIGYTDEEGNAKTYVFAGTGAVAGATTAAAAAKAYVDTIKDTSGTYAGNAANAIANAEEFNRLFDVTSDASGVITFTAKSGGNQTITSFSGTATAGGATGSLGTATPKVNAKLRVSFGSVAAGTNATNTVFKAGSKISVGGHDIYLYDSNNVDPSLRTAIDGYNSIDISATGADTIAEFVTTLVSLSSTDNIVAGPTGYDNTITIQGMDYEDAPTFTMDGLTLSDTTDGKTASNTKGVTFQIGANGTADQRVTLKVGNQSVAGLGLNNISVAKQEDANKAIATIDAAINSVSGTRADLGALQNRLEHTINSLGVASENLTAAESRIRDVDMAKEMMNFTKTQILSQAAQAMLAQANTLPQGVLQLLR